MDILYYIDPETGIDHIAGHGVDRAEVEEVLRKPLEEMRGRSGTVIVHGRTRGGRYLKVIYVPDDEGDGIFVVTAYDLSSRQLHGLKRRLRRRPR